MKIKIKKKTKKKLLIAGTALFGLFFLASHFEHYRAAPIVAARDVAALTFIPEGDGLKLTAKAYTVDESIANLDRNVLKKGYQPVQITIQNNSPTVYQMGAESLSLPTTDSDKVAWKFTQDAIPRGVALKIASIFFWPLSIASTIDGVKTFKTYKHLKKDFKAKTLDKSEVVAPYSTITRIIFVPKDKFESDFSVTLQNQETGDFTTHHLSSGE